MERSFNKSVNTGIKVRCFFILFINDIVFLILSGLLTYYLRFYTSFFGRYEPISGIDPGYVLYSLVFICTILAMMAIFKVYNWAYIYNGMIYYIKIMGSIMIGSAATLSFGWFRDSFYFSKVWILINIFFSLVFIILSRYFIGLYISKNLIRRGNILKEIIYKFSDCLRSLKFLSRIRKKVFYGIILVINDCILLSLCFYLSYFIRFQTGDFASSGQIAYLDFNYQLYSIIFISTALIILYAFRLYDWDKIYKGSGYYSRLMRAIIYNIIAIILVGYIFNLFTFSRKWIGLLALLSIVLIFISRFLIESITRRLIKRLNISFKTIIVGIGGNAERIEDSLEKQPQEGYEVIGYVDEENKIIKAKKENKNIKILGNLNNIASIISDNSIQTIIISGTEYKYFEALEILEKLKKSDVSVLLFPGFFEFSMKRVDMREVGGVPLMQVMNIGFSGVNLFLKNLIDYLMGIIMFLFFIPIYLIIGLAIKLNSPGPVFYQQKRYTKDCRVFYMYKFRSMYVDAEQRLAGLQDHNEADGPLFKMKRDPRITGVGRFIRRFSIDELPQIINVLKGELSLVGPRPPIPEEVEQYDEWEMKRMNVKQGITGLWQVSGRSELSFDEMARLDLYYIQNWSIEMDIKIILKTIPTVLFGKGAY
ncbi:MAG: sugar transferase [Actinomycetia bacterium]|nr:sugar transferase [Actinomycetes bacterium]